MNEIAFDRASELLGAIPGKRLLVLGDLMLDEYLFGEVSRISPEAPVPVVRVRREASRLGGAGNVAANARALGALPVLAGVLGDDASAQRFRAEMDRQSLDRRRLVVDRGRPTTVKTRVIAHSQQVVRCDREEDHPLAPEVEELLVDAFMAALGEADAVVISDYAKGALTPRVLKEALNAARALRLPVVVDPKVKDLSLYRGATALTPNHHEALSGAQVDGQDDAAITEAARRILERLDSEALLITRGEQGMTLYQQGGARRHIPAVAREVFDVSGAGDTVSTVFTLALAAGATPLEAAALSNHAAGVVVGKVGTSTAGAGEILRSLSPGG